MEDCFTVTIDASLHTSKKRSLISQGMAPGQEFQQNQVPQKGDPFQNKQSSAWITLRDQRMAGSFSSGKHEHSQGCHLLNPYYSFKWHRRSRGSYFQIEITLCSFVWSRCFFFSFVSTFTIFLVVWKTCCGWSLLKLCDNRSSKTWNSDKWNLGTRLHCACSSCSRGTRWHGQSVWTSMEYK